MWTPLRCFTAIPLALAVVLLLSLPLVLAEPYNITIYDESPTITYLPSRSGDSATTWNSSYTISGPYNNQSGQMGLGESYHYTTADGASASLGFVGTAIYVWGNNYGNESDVRLQVGGQDLERGEVEGLLGWKDGLKNEWWEFTVNITSGRSAWDGFDLRRITVTVDFGGKGATFENTTLSMLDENDNPNPQVSFSGSWTTGTEAGLAKEPYNRVDTYGQDARIFIPTLGRTTLVVVYGSVNDDHGSYMFSASELAPHWPSSQFFNGSSPWIAINEVVWFGVVTGGQLLGQNLEGGMWFDVSRVDYVDAFGGRHPHKVNPGAIAGGVVGGLAGLGLILAAFWFFFWRRRKSKPQHYKSGQSYGDGFEIDSNNENGSGAAKRVNESDDIEMTTTRTATSSNGVDSPSATVVPETTELQATSSEDPPSTHQDPMITPFAPVPLAQALTTPAPSSANGTQRSHDRLTLVSPDPVTDTGNDTNQPPVPALPAMTPAESSRKARRQQREAAAAVAAAQGQPGFVQETDAGRVALLPPSYDPAWAQEGIPIDTSHPSTVTNPANETVRPEPETARRSEDMGERTTGTGAGAETDLSPAYDHLALGPTIGSEVEGPEGEDTSTPTPTPTTTVHPPDGGTETREESGRPESVSGSEEPSQASPTTATTT